MLERGYRHFVDLAMLIVEENEDFREKHPKLCSRIPVKTPEVVLGLIKVLLIAGLSRPAKFKLISIAAKEGHASIIQLFFEIIGPQAVPKDIIFMSIYFTAEYGHLEALKVLLALNPVPAEAKKQALWKALDGGHVECARLLISSGLDANDTDILARAFTGSWRGGGGCSIPRTVEENADKVVLELVTMLVNAGANVNASCKRRRYCRDSEYSHRYEISILSLAALSCQWQAGNFLIAHGADITAKDDRGWGVLHCAVSHGCPEPVEYFLNAGAAEQVKWKISTIVEEGHDRAIRNWTALDILGMCDWPFLDAHRLLPVQYARIVKLLVDNGADLDAKNNLGNTPLHSACRIGDKTTPAGLKRSLKQYYTSDDEFEEPSYDVSIRSLPVIAALLQAGANPNALNNLGQTPLHVLLEGGMSDLQQLPKDFYQEAYFYLDNDEMKPFVRDWLASFCSTVRVLVDAGADLNHRDKKGQKPLHAFLQSVSKIYRERDVQERHDQEMVEEEFQFHPILATLVDPIIVELVRGGARSWGSVPTPCFGIQKALFGVWKHGGSTELGYLVDRLDSGEKARILPRLQTCLLLFNRLLPGRPELHMQILAEAL